MLVAAAYADAYSLTLEFDRDIDLAGIVPGVIVVDDGDSGFRYAADQVLDVPTPRRVELGLSEFGTASGPGVRLDASAGNGIVALDDGGTWGGVSALALPFP
jgi:hypothetical protein